MNINKAVGVDEMTIDMITASGEFGLHLLCRVMAIWKEGNHRMIGRKQR